MYKEINRDFGYFYFAENDENLTIVLALQLTMDMDKDRMDEAMDLETALEIKSS